MDADEKTCPRCAETIKSAAVVCRFCGHEFGAAAQQGPSSGASIRQAIKDSPPLTNKPKGQLGKGIALGCAGLIGLAVIGAIVGGGAKDSQNGTAATSNTDAALSNADAALNAAAAETSATSGGEGQSNWSYDTERDQVRGKNVYYASVDSQNQVDFDFPYGGGSTLTMTVRKHPQYGQDVIFHISKGQFVCGVENCSGTINYGSGPQRLSLNEPGDYDSQSLFASNGPGVITHLKSAEKVVVELPFYQEGNRQFTFSTKGLKWQPSG